MAGSATSSPKKPCDNSYDNLVLSNLSSPRFDISDFLKTPTDGSPREEPLYTTFQSFTLPTTPFMGPTSTSTTIRDPTPHHYHTAAAADHVSAAAAAAACSNRDFGSSLLFEDCKGGDLGMDSVLHHGDLIPFDDYIDGVLDGRDSFSIFNDVNYDTTVSSNPATIGYVPCISADNGMLLPSLSGPTPSLYVPPEPYLGSEAGGLLEVGDCVLVSLEGGASTSGGAPNGLLYPNNQIDWGLMSQEALVLANLRQQSMLRCESCQLLRRIIHSNGVQDTKLEIHGCHGQGYHAVLQTRFCIDDGFPSTLEQQIVDFPVGNSEYVKQFLLQYSMLRSKEGFILRHDSLQVPMDLSFIAPELVFGGAKTQMLNQSGQSKMNDGDCSTDHADASVLPVKPPKSNAAAQRERTGKLKMSDLAQFFHLPINAAAKELGICPTVLKKICRRNGMRRWPHRKVTIITQNIYRIVVTFFLLKMNS